MSYTKNTWATGDTITAAKLNGMEEGIEAANEDYPGYDVAMLIDYDAYTGQVVKGSYADIRAKLEANTPIDVYFFGYHAAGRARIYKECNITLSTGVIWFAFTAGGTTWKWFSDGSLLTDD